MAMTVVWTAMVTLSLVFGIAMGNLDAVAAAAMEGAASAVTLCISMAGITALWTGIMKIAESALVSVFPYGRICGDFGRREALALQLYVGVIHAVGISIRDCIERCLRGDGRIRHD